MTRRFLLLLVIVLLAPCAASWGQSRQAQLTWWDRTDPARGGRIETSRFYTFRSDLPREELRQLADHMDTMYVEYSKRMAGLEQRTPEHLSVYIFSRQIDYLETLRLRFGINAMGSGGMFFVSPAGSGLAFFIEGLPMTRVHHVIQHEGFHQFASSRFGNDLPMWVNEGLAEFFGEAVVVGRQVIIGQSNPRVLNSLKNAIELKKHIGFHDMVTMTPQRWNARVQSGEASLQYMQAWSMVHFLVYGDGGKYQAAFEGYLKRLNAGLNSEEAFIQAFQTSNLDEFETRWREYALRATPSAFLSAMERAGFLAEGMLAVMEKGKSPQTLEELKAAMQEIQFVYTITTHGQNSVLKASDASLFEIPRDELAKEQPRFVLARPKLRGLNTRERKLEESHPTPSSIVAEHLEPRSLIVNWSRLPDGEHFTYEIVAK